MITALDHIVLICPDLLAGVENYTTLLGREADWRAVDPEAGAASALFRLDNVALELLAPSGAGPAGDRLRDLLSAGGPRLTSLAFQTDNIKETHHVLTRRGLEPSDIVAGASTDAVTARLREWQRFRCSDVASGGIKTFVLQNTAGALSPTTVGGQSAHSLDHLVINTPNPDRAAAHYGARLQLRLARDRTAEQWKTRFLFFRLGGLTLEVIHSLAEPTDASGPDAIWGLTWAVADLEAAHARLRKAGRNISDIRTGRKPGSHVFTVRDGTLQVPTLFIAHETR